MIIRHIVEEGVARLDRFLTQQHPHIARSRWEAWIRDGKVLVNGTPATKPGEKLKNGYVVESALPELPAPGLHLDPEPIDLPTLFEDERLWIINKPADIVVHPGPGHPSGTVVNALLWRLQQASQGKAICFDHNSLEIETPEEEAADDSENGTEELAPTLWPGLVHRLDRYTSGCLVTTKDQAAQQCLQDQFKARTVEKRYLAIVRHSRRLPELGSMLIDAPIARHRLERLKMTITTNGRPSQTRVKVLGKSAGLALVECELLTGRTHQIRVHLSHIGAPILGDPLYGGMTRWQDQDKQPIQCPHPMLHAWKLEVDHPSNGQRIKVEASLPKDFADLLERLTLTF